jgi:hypothetical protein
VKGNVSEEVVVRWFGRRITAMELRKAEEPETGFPKNSMRLRYRHGMFPSDLVARVVQGSQRCYVRPDEELPRCLMAQVDAGALDRHNQPTAIAQPLSETLIGEQNKVFVGSM